MFVSGLERRLPHSARPGEQEQGPRQRRPGPDRDCLDRGRDHLLPDPVGRFELLHQGLPGAARRCHGGVVHVDGAALQRRVLRPARVPREVQGSPAHSVGPAGRVRVVGVIADVAAVFLLFWGPWAAIFTKSGWALAVGAIAVVSIGIGLAIYFVSERGRKERVGPEGSRGAARALVSWLASRSPAVVVIRPVALADPQPRPDQPICIQLGMPSGEGRWRTAGGRQGHRDHP